MESKILKPITLKYMVPILIILMLVLDPSSMNYVTAQTISGEEFTGEIDSLSDTRASTKVLKHQSYLDTNATEQDAYIEKSNDFVNPQNEYELDRNNLLIKLGLITLELKITSDADTRIKLEEEYDKTLKELEEYGVGPQGKTFENSSYYFDKYDQKIKEIESTSKFKNTHTDNDSLSNQVGYYFLVFQMYLTWLLVILLGFLIMGVDLLV